MDSSQVITKALEIIFDGVLSVLNSLGISATDLEAKRKELVSNIANDQTMLENDEILH